MNVRRKPGLALRILFLTVLLTAQGFVSAHGIDHLSLDDSSACAICAVGTGLDNSAVDTLETFHATPDTTVPAVPLNACLPEQFPVRRPSRGPPGSL